MVDKQVIFDTSENIGSQKPNGAPPTRSVSSNRLPTKPVDISFPGGNDLRKSVSEIFSSHNSSQHPGYSQSLPTFTSLKVLTPRAPLFKSRPTPNEDLIPPLSLPPSNNFFEENSVSRRSQSVQVSVLHSFPCIMILHILGSAAPSKSKCQNSKPEPTI